VGTFLRHSVEGPDRGCASSYSNQQCGWDCANCKSLLFSHQHQSNRGWKST